MPTKTAEKQVKNHSHKWEIDNQKQNQASKCINDKRRDKKIGITQNAQG
jgi:hypothetical protein